MRRKHLDHTLAVKYSDMLNPSFDSAMYQSTLIPHPPLLLLAVVVVIATAAVFGALKRLIEQLFLLSIGVTAMPYKSVALLESVVADDTPDPIPTASRGVRGKVRSV